MVNERVIKNEGRQEGHEQLCAERGAQMLREIAELRAYIVMVTKIGMCLAFALFALELGKATFPAIFAALHAL